MTNGRCKFRHSDFVQQTKSIGKHRCGFQAVTPALYRNTAAVTQTTLQVQHLFTAQHIYKSNSTSNPATRCGSDRVSGSFFSLIGHFKWFTIQTTFIHSLTVMQWLFFHAFRDLYHIHTLTCQQYIRHNLVLYLVKGNFSMLTGGAAAFTSPPELQLIVGNDASAILILLHRFLWV